MFVPFIATTAGWVLTELGRQPWIVQGLLKTANANSPNVTTTWLVVSLSVFVSLYAILLAADIWLMRRYAGRELGGENEHEAPETAPVAAY
jgi:cytochrome d ubiquinol oxidase subunit I